MFIFNKNKIPTKEIIPGFFGKIIHSDNITTAYWEVKAGSFLPEHTHIHEQITEVIDGHFEMIINGKKYDLKSDDIAVIPGNIIHSGKAVTNCKLKDTFYPIRKEYN